MRPDHPSWAADRRDDRDDDDHDDRDHLDVPATTDDTERQLHPVLDRPVLATAFGRRRGQPADPSELVVDALAGEEDVVSHVLHPSLRRAREQVDGLVRMVDPLAVVCFAVGAVAAVRIESHDGSPTTRLDADRIADALRTAGVPVGPPSAPGDDLGGHVLGHVRTRPALVGRPAGLVRVPAVGAPGFAPSVFGLVGRAVIAGVVSLLADGHGR